MSDRAISTRRGKGVSILGKPNIKYLLVVSNELSFDLLLLYVPYRACGVNGAGTQGGGVSLVPVKGSQWSLALGVLH